MKRFYLLLLVIFTLFTFSCNKKGELQKSCEEKYSNLTDGLYAVIITDKGDIVLNLEFEKTPLTVTNFVALAEGNKSNAVQKKGKPFFDGLTFHRVEPNFVIQGGDPNGNGTGGPGYKFADEFHIDLKHNSEGILSMANSGPGTNGSQFFITLSATPHLDGKHTVFGKVISGMDVVKNIEQNDKIKNIIVIRKGDSAKNFKATEDDFKKFKNSNLERKIAYYNALEAIKIKEIESKFSDATQTASGLRYIVSRKGWGGKPNRGDKIKVHYTGKLLTGEIFDSSLSRGTPFEFNVGTGQVIKGWDEAFLDMKKGEKRTLIIPPNLGYGTDGAGSIPPSSWLIFDVEFL